MDEKLYAGRLGLRAAVMTWAASLVACGGGAEPAERGALDPLGDSIPVAQVRPVSFGRDIAPLLFESCVSCHRPGTAAPFSLLSFEDASLHAKRIAAVTANRDMPPWLPEPRYGEFAGDRRLSEEQIALIQAWVDAGAPEGDRTDLPRVPEWPEGWLLGEPDLMIKMVEPFTVPPDGTDLFRNFVIPIPVSSGKWVKAVELRPGNTRAVHHGVMRIDRTPASRRLDELDPAPGYESRFHTGSAQNPGGFFLGWTPGKVPYAGADDMSWRLEEGADLVLQLHLRPTGKPEAVYASVGFYFADRPPARIPSLISLESRNIDIPPGQKDYTISDSYVLPVDVEALGVYPHAHYLCKEMKGFATLPDGTRRWLLRIDDWDFNWQDEYRFVTPTFLPKGTTLSMIYTYDNSVDNPQNPNRPPKRVVFGPLSADEMGFLLIQVVLRDSADLAVLNKDYASKYAPKRMAGLRQALRLNPDNAITHFELGVALQEEGSLDEAIRHYRRAIQIDVDLAEVHNNLGIVLREQGKLDEAIGHYREAIRVRPEYATAHHNLGVLLGGQGQRDEAIRHYRQAVRIDDGVAETHNNLGTALAAQGNISEAIEHLRKAALLEAQPASLSILSLLLATHPDPQIRDPTEAIGLAERAAEMTGHRDPLVLDVLAAAYAADGRFDEAVRTATNAAALAAAAQAEELADQIREHLKLYQESKPYRLTPGRAATPP